MNRFIPGVRMTCQLAAVAVVAFFGTSRPLLSAELLPRLRQPAALSLSGDGSRLLVANARSGSLSVVALKEARVIAEHDVGRSLADVVALPDGRHWLAVDQGTGALLLLAYREHALDVLKQQSVAADPVAVAVTGDGRSCVVASRWSRRLTFVRVSTSEGSDPSGLEITRTLELPFSPRNMVLVRGGARLIVADAFGGRLAVVDPARATLEVVHTLPAHNIRGLAESPDGQTLVVAHQVLHRLARTSFEDIHWGSLLGNALRVLKLERVLDSERGADGLRDSRAIDLGDPGNGAGDPAAAAFTRDGHFLVALAGVDEVRIGTAPGRLPLHTGVGRRPTALVASADSRVAYVANTLDDTIAVIDLPSGLYRATIALGPRPELTASDRGERLFFSARLSHDGWMSCQSCHTDGHTSGDSSDTLGDGGYGAPKRIPSLLGAGATGPWGWLGSFARLEDQVRQSLESTMQGAAPDDTTVSDLVSYLRTLEPPPPAMQAAAARVERGRAVFHARKCAECHAPPQYTTGESYDVDLADEVGHRRFNPPSLRGVGQRAPLLHDGRARTLDEVFRRYGHPRNSTLFDAEVDALVAFLETL
jgi:cytochrome c peroxidase